MDAEHELVRRSLAGDRLASTRLIEAHQAAARRVASALLGSGDDADDVVQEAFVKALTRLEQFDTGRSFRPWLLTIVANEARNRRRASGRRQAVTLRLAERTGAGDGPPPDDPADAHETAERRRQLADAVAALPDRDREIVALRFFAELTEAETAEALGCPAGTVKSRLSRALTRLRSTLSEEVSP